MKRLKYSLYATAGILALALVLTAVGPKHVLAALGFTPVREVDAPGRSPYQELTAFTFANSITTDYALSAVPANSRLAIEQVTGTASVPSGQSGFFFVRTTAGGRTSFHTLPITQRFADSVFPGTDLLVITQPIRFYADPGTRPEVSFRRSSSSGSASFQVGLSGYFIGL